MNERIQSTDIRERHIQRQLRHKRIMKRRRIIFFTVLSLTVISIVLFFTPLFNIKHIEIYGNSKIETGVIKQAVGSIEEENLFRLNTKKIIENVKTIPYADDLHIKKNIFPVGLEITVTECVPACFVFYNDHYVILDKNLKILEETDTVPEGICEISGIDVTAVTPGAILATDDNDKLLSAAECISSLIEQELITRTNKIDFTNMSSIMFTYENRLNVVCGSSVDFQKKIGMFIKAVNSSKLNENSRGTIDISISGKAIYTP